MKISKVDFIAKSYQAKKLDKNFQKKTEYSNNVTLSNLYYQPAFGRKWAEHQSWGLRLNDDGSSSAKLFTFPDAKSVNLLLNENSPRSQILPLKRDKTSLPGVFFASFEPGLIKEGDSYRFIIEKSDGTIERVKDPYSFSQPELMGPSRVYDHNRFKWSDDDWWINKKNPARISGDKSIRHAKIYELNVASLTQQGNFDGVKGELQRIKDLGFNAIEIMPVENTYSYNWGYDGVDKFAPANYMGGPDKLKELVNEAHLVGLNVIMDMVPNHLGPDGSQLAKTGPYIKGETQWGSAFNYDGENSRYVRDFMVNAALNWIHNYHCDGLRLDMTPHMRSDATMKQIAAEVKYHYPDAFLIAEDGREHVTVYGDNSWNDPWQPHDQRIINPLESNLGIDHESEIEAIESLKTSLNKLGYDSEWDFPFCHTIAKLGYDEVDIDALERMITDSGNRIKYSTSHDETGNNDGTRTVAKFMVPLLKLADFVVLNDEDIKRAGEYALRQGKNYPQEAALATVKSQKVQQISMKLAQLVQLGQIEEVLSSSDDFWKLIQSEGLEISSDAPIDAKSVLDAFLFSVKKYRAIEALKYFAPGPVMTFQGEENIDMTKFNFFREFDSIKDEHYLYVEKGYPYGLSAYLDSQLGRMQYTNAAKERMEQFQRLIVDLNAFKENNPASTVGSVQINSSIKHSQNPTMAFHAKDELSGNETFVVANFSNLDYPIYEIDFPKGAWREVINTNDKKYGGSGTCQNSRLVLSVQNGLKSKISIPAKSTLIFSKI